MNENEARMVGERQPEDRLMPRDDARSGCLALTFNEECQV